MRILNVIRSVDPATGGPGEGLRQAVQAAQRLGHRHDVLTLDGPDHVWLGDWPGTIHALGPVRLDYGYTPALVPWLKAHAGSFDAVIVHGLWQYHGLAVRRALHGTAVPYFLYCHGMLDPWFKHAYPLKHLKKWLYWPWADYRVARDAQTVLFTAEEERVLAAQSFWLYRAREAVVGYGLALSPDAQAATANDFLGLHRHLRGRRLLLFLSRLHEKKGCDLLIEAFAGVAGSDPHLHLVMAGPDAVGIRPALQRLAQRLGVADRITWTGMLAGRAKWGAMRAAEVFVLPSHQENFGIAVAEALAVGLPVLISNRVNIWCEIVEAGAGFAEADTLDGTVQLLRRWLTLEPERRAQMSACAVNCFRQHFHVDTAAGRLAQTLATGIASARAGLAPAARLPAPAVHRGAQERPTASASDPGRSA